jgi:arabinoxylan arabinofuranohydrolase
MKPTHIFRAVCLAALAAYAPILKADYPIVSQRYIADPTGVVIKDRVYVYCSDDDKSPVEGSYVIPDVVCVSSSDMKNWTDHGVVFSAEKDTKWAKKTWAPTAIERDGKVFLYYGNGGGNIGVVCSTSPTGPFIDPIGKYLIDGNTPGVKPAEHMWLFDPAVYIDDDGQAYMYFGGNGDDNVRIAKLNRDMISVDGEILRMSAPNFFEASWMHKRNGVYYFSYSTNPKAGMRIDYMTSDKPTTGFTYRGVLAPQPPINSNNNHASEFLFKGQWYHVYHNRIVAKQAGIPTGFRRNLAVEVLEYNDDGSIKPVAYTEDGVPQVGHLNPYVRVEAETFHAQSGVKTEPCSAGGMDVCDIHNGSWIQVSGVDFGTMKARNFKVQAASGEQGGCIELRLDSPEGQLIGTCDIGNTGGWQSWKSFSSRVSNASGVHDLYLKFKGGEKQLFCLDWWQFE